MQSPIQPELGLFRRIAKKYKSNQLFYAETSYIEGGEATDMARFRVTPIDVEGSATLKQREMNLDDAIVEDTPPSKQVCETSSGVTHRNVEGSGRLKQRILSLSDDTPPSTQVHETSKGRTKNEARRGSCVASMDGGKCTKRRSKPGSVEQAMNTKHVCSRKPPVGNNGEIRQTAYRSSLNGIRTLFEELDLSKGHKKIMKKTPFWRIFQAIFDKKLTPALCRKSDQMIINIINAYDPATDGFKLGRKSIKLTRADIFNIFGISGGSEKVILKYGSRDSVEMVKRGLITEERLTSSSLKEQVKKYAKGKNKADMEDFVRLLCVYLLHSLFFPTSTSVKWVYLERIEDLRRLKNYDWCGAILDELMSSVRQKHNQPRRVSGCVVVLLYWLCEHTNLVNPVNPEETLGIVKWRTTDLAKEFGKKSLIELKSKQLVSRQPHGTDRTMIFATGKVTNDEVVVLSSIRSGFDGRNDTTIGYEDGSERDQIIPRLLTGNKCGSVMIISSGKSEYEREQTGVEKMDGINDVTFHTDYCGNLAARNNGILQGCGISIEDCRHHKIDDQNAPLIGELRDQITKMEEHMKHKEEKHASDIAKKDEEIASLNETVLLLLSENSELLEDLTETVVHAVTQNAVLMTVEEQERSMVTRLRTRMRKDTKKDEFIYERKRKRCTGEAEKLDPKDDPKQVVDVENFSAGQKKELGKPIPIKNIRTNAVHRYLLREEKDKIKRIWDEADTSTIIWSGTHMGCCVFPNDIRQLMIESAISGNVIDAYAEVLSNEQGSRPDEMQGDCTQATNNTAYVFTCSFLADNARVQVSYRTEESACKHDVTDDFLPIFDVSNTLWVSLDIACAQQ
ncbi:uncharacterized protein LOC131334384 isoform X2 [Rhododendron vialii]|uniref:uncharacterized protein LOC131334384 isoform X2 n=1 Tax=Rhododendron vialii TaxID=182163 RepID=UPI00265DE04B|nr:uncharacterized protein LOC131334384 isoform X2 [Rhododendron vialii]